MNSLPRVLLDRLRLLPWTCLFIVVLNFIVIHRVERTQSLQKMSLNDDFSHELSFSFKSQNKPLYINIWPFVSEEKIQQINTEHPDKIESYASFMLPQLYALHAKTHEERWHDLISWASLDGQSMRDQKEVLISWGFLKKIQLMITATRFFDFMKKGLYFDFGTLSNDSHQKIVSYALQRLSFSLKLLALPWLGTLFGAIFLGLIMAYYKHTLLGRALYILCTLLYAVPLYVMIPMLIEKIGLNNHLPIHGINFFSPLHYLLPICAIFYGALAIYSRFNKTLFEQLFSRDYLLIAKMNHFSVMRQVFVHILREAWTSFIPLLLGAFNFFFGTLVIVEVLFELDGFGRFFYQSILMKDFNATLFCILVASFLSILGHWLADVFLYYFDPRIRDRGTSRVF